MEKPKRKNRWISRRNLNYLLLALAVALILFSFYSLSLAPFKTDVLNVRFMVGKTIGIDLNSSEVNFGMINPGGSATRNVIIHNDYNHPILIDISVSRNIVKYLFVDSSFSVSINESIKIPIKLGLPKDLEFGNYSGKIKFEFRKIKG
jgi:hypothetical protein